MQSPKKNSPKTLILFMYLQVDEKVAEFYAAVDTILLRQVLTSKKVSFFRDPFPMHHDEIFSALVRR